MDNHDFSFDEDDEEHHQALRSYFTASPGRGRYEPRKPHSFEPRYIDTTQQPEDRPDYGMWSTLGSILTPFGIASIVLAVIIVKFT